MKRLQHAFRCLLLCTLLACVISVPASAISDVPKGFWAKSEIERAVSLKYFSTESDVTFGVGKEMSRAEFLEALGRFFGWTSDSPQSVYEDVLETASYAGVVEAAYRQGAITSQDSRFRPDDPITRAEAAAMLVRALGYTDIAGPVQDFPLPFEDVRVSSSYIVMAYGMGFMDGTSAASFSPDGRVTREQAAVILMRLHNKLHSTIRRTGVATSSAGLPDLKGYEAVGVASYRLAYNGDPQLTSILDPEEVQAICSAVTAAGAKPLLYVSGGPYHLREGDAKKMADVLLQNVKAGGYEGLFLDITDLTTAVQRDELTATAKLLREGLKGQLLYIGVEAPSWTGEDSGYDYALLGKTADQLVLRATQAGEEADGLTVAPLDPMERLYGGLLLLRDKVDAGKLSLMITSMASNWVGEAGEAVTAEELAEYLAANDSHYSSRYGCAYLPLEEDGEALTIWYHNAQSIEDRVQLARLFGASRLCLSDLNNTLPETLAAMP